MIENKAIPEFKLIVAGGRDFNNYDAVVAEIEQLANNELAEHAVSIVSGMARGADRLAWKFAQNANVVCHEFPADWDNLSAQGAIIKYNRSGKAYNAFAGHDRNARMAEFADGLLAFWDGQSKGTANMIGTMRAMGKSVRVIRY